MSKCLSPFVPAVGRLAYPCGDCAACRLNRRRIWAHRIMLEAWQHEFSSFVTLTYEDDRKSLEPWEFRDWLKRLRFRLDGSVSLRYYAVGEYGERSMRPHYHLAAFGLPTCQGSPRVMIKGGGFLCRCQSCSVVRETWGFGHVLIGTLEASSAAYIAGYVTKKLTQKPRLPASVEPPFVRMSLKPGIGAYAVRDVASAVMRYRWLERNLDVPNSLGRGKGSLPLGRYLMKKLRLEVGREEGCPEAVVESLRESLRPVFESAWLSSRSSGVGGRLTRSIVAEAIASENVQAARNLAAKGLIHGKNGARL